LKLGAVVQQQPGGQGAEVKTEGEDRVQDEGNGRGDATIYYPLLRAGGPAVAIEVWSLPAAPINAISELAGGFRVIAMDQRNAGGRSRAPITAADGWHTYTADMLVRQ
jgi:pimeloyl-ACP methyl ester carboxylesterase